MPTAAQADPAAEPRRRLTKDARREQLLDVAADLVVQQGVQALTMERLAERAGVSKALPYSHFDRSEAVLVELYLRETRSLAGRVAQALEDRAPNVDPVEVTVRTYFAAVEERGAILAIVAAPGSTIAEMAETDLGAGPAFVAELLVRHFGLKRKRARLVGGIVLSTLLGATDVWTSGVGTKSEVQAETIAFLRAGLA